MYARADGVCGDGRWRRMKVVEVITSLKGKRAVRCEAPRALTRRGLTRSIFNRYLHSQIVYVSPRWNLSGFRWLGSLTASSTFYRPRLPLPFFLSFPLLVSPLLRYVYLLLLSLSLFLSLSVFETWSLAWAWPFLFGSRVHPSPRPE